MLATFGETSGTFTLQRMKKHMERDPVGKQILMLVFLFLISFIICCKLLQDYEETLCFTHIRDLPRLVIHSKLSFLQLIL